VIRMETVLECKNVTKYFGGLAAVNDVNLEVGKGEIVGLIGPNGAGKTTLFHLISGFEKPTSGTINFKGGDITGLKPFKIANKGVTRTFQLVRPFYLMTPINSLVVALLSDRAKRMGDQSKDIQDRAWGLLELVGMAEPINMVRLCNTLPYGDLKRLEIARALASKPELLLLDEPFAGLAPEEVTRMQLLIQKLQKEGNTIIAVEHILRPLMKIVNRVIVLHHGQKISEGTPKQIAEDRQVIEAYLGARGLALA